VGVDTKRESEDGYTKSFDRSGENIESMGRSGDAPEPRAMRMRYSNDTGRSP